jgi:hypothetical protein
MASMYQPPQLGRGPRIIIAPICQEGSKRLRRRIASGASTNASVPTPLTETPTPTHTLSGKFPRIGCLSERLLAILPRETNLTAG